MPQRPKPTATDVRMIIAIGGVSLTWGHLELALTAILAELLEVRPETGFILSAALDYRHHRDLISSLSQLKLKDHPKLAEKLRSFLSQVRGMNTERNSTIHAIWHQDPSTGKNRRLTMRNRGENENGIPICKSAPYVYGCWEDLCPCKRGFGFAG
jgi:hypothetical protein